MTTEAWIASVERTPPDPEAPAPRPVAALGMFSGGLDSQIAALLLREQGIRVELVTFDSPFFDIHRARQAAARMNLALQVQDFGPELVAIIRSPRHGFGAHLNPCIDCHIAMLRRTGELMEQLGFDFIFTGEVLNQRPMSQNRQALQLIANQCGYAPLLLRPLSAPLLDPTEPERRGLVDRSRLPAINGRSRREQLSLAARFGISEIPPVAGGCRLTEPNFARRLNDLISHEGLRGMRAIELLKIGRHFRLSPTVKLIVGRNQRDNLELEGNAELYDLLLKPDGVPGPTGLVPITVREEELRMAAAICARYSDAPPDACVRIRIRSTQGVQRMETRPGRPEDIEPFLI